jgi:hypothetical protein
MYSSLLEAPPLIVSVNGTLSRENAILGSNAEFVVNLGLGLGRIIPYVRGVDVLRFAALAGNDEIFVEDTTGIDLGTIEFELKGRTGATTSDGEVDQITIDGSLGGDRVTLTSKGTLVAIQGFGSFVQISHPDPEGTS